MQNCNPSPRARKELRPLTVMQPDCEQTLVLAMVISNHLPVMISNYATETTRLICGSTKHGAKINVFCLRLFQFDENDSEPETCGAIQMFFLTYGTTHPRKSPFKKEHHLPQLYFWAQNISFLGCNLTTLALLQSLPVRCFVPKGDRDN